MSKATTKATPQRLFVLFCFVFQPCMWMNFILQPGDEGWWALSHHMDSWSVYTYGDVHRNSTYINVPNEIRTVVIYDSHIRIYIYIYIYTQSKMWRCSIMPDSNGPMEFDGAVGSRVVLIIHLP